MPDVTVEQLASEYGLLFCVECGKCVAVCPMGKIFDDFAYEASPRGVIEKVLLNSEMPDDSRLWFCLTCDLCTSLCPAGVRFRDFMDAVRQWIIQSGDADDTLRGRAAFCRNCGAYLWPRHTVEYLKQMLGQAAEELLTLCPKCRQFGFGEKVKALIPGDRQARARTAQAGGSR